MSQLSCPEATSATPAGQRLNVEQSQVAWMADT
jgi:hypothetical protein